MQLPKYYLPIRRSHLDNKSVQWTSLQRTPGKRVDYDRQVYNGTVLVVSSCGQFAMVQDTSNNVHDMEIADLTVL